MKFKPGDIIVCTTSSVYSNDDRLKLKQGGLYKVKEYNSIVLANRPIIYIIDFKGYGTDETYGYYEDRFEKAITVERLLKLKKLNESR
jgi:hypothetical protein